MTALKSATTLDAGPYRVDVDEYLLKADVAQMLLTQRGLRGVTAQNRRLTEDGRHTSIEHCASNPELACGQPTITVMIVAFSDNGSGEAMNWLEQFIGRSVARSISIVADEFSDFETLKQYRLLNQGIFYVRSCFSDRASSHKQAAKPAKQAGGNSSVMFDKVGGKNPLSIS